MVRESNEDLRKKTDKYFERTEAALDEMSHNPEVIAEITESQYPEGKWRVLTGVNEAAEIAKEAGVDFSSLEEGRLFNGGPVAKLKGNYRDFARFETALLGVLSHNSGMATNAIKTRLAAENSKVLSFGARHIHPNVSELVPRNAMIGGFDGFSFVASEEEMGMEASGTMPHALMLSLGKGKQEKAWRAFHEAVDDDVPRIALVDTFNDEVDEVLRAVEELGEDLDGVRLDTTSSRRGDFRRIIKEVKHQLEEIGRSDVDIFVSGGLGPEEVSELDNIVDGFGVGSYVSEAECVDFSLDIVEVEGEPISKRGKLPGEKKVVRQHDGRTHNVVRVGKNSDDDLIVPVVENGEIVREFNWEDSKKRVMEEVENLGVQAEDIR